MKIYTTDEMRIILEEFVGLRFNYNDIFDYNSIITAFDTEDYIHIVEKNKNFYLVYQEHGADYEGVTIITEENETGNEIITAVY